MSNTDMEEKKRKRDNLVIAAAMTAMVILISLAAFLYPL
jgi:hypothetical protein